MRLVVLILFFLTNLISYSLSDDKIVFINVNYIFTNSTTGKNASETIEKKVKKLEIDIKKFSSDINLRKDKLVKQKNILSEDDFKKRLDEIDKEVKEFNNNIKVKNNEILRLKEKVMSNFKKELTKILSQYSKDNSIELIIEQENVLIGLNKLNITNEILKIINSEKIELIN